MKILAFDLVWDGLTGWVYWDTDLDDPVIAYGEFKPKANYKLTGVAHQQALCLSLQDNIWVVMDAFKADTFAFEFTDWFQDVFKGSIEERKKRYAQERKVRETLGMAKAAFILAASEFPVRIYGIGAAEVKHEFGAIRKDAAAKMICQEYPRFTVESVNHVSSTGQLHSVDVLFGNKADGFFLVVDNKSGGYVAHHVTDAIVVASVVSKRLKLDELAN